MDNNNPVVLKLINKNGDVAHEVVVYGYTQGEKKYSLKVYDPSGFMTDLNVININNLNLIKIPEYLYKVNASGETWHYYFVYTNPDKPEYDFHIDGYSTFDDIKERYDVIKYAD